MACIADTSSIILLAKIGRLALLRDLYEEVHVPPGVAAELRAKPDAASQEVASFLEAPGCVRAPRNVLLFQALSADLGVGEAEAITLAAEIPNGVRIMDDSEGRRAARRLGLTVTGLLGILIEAKARGLIPKISPLLEELIGQGFWLSEAMRRIVLDAVAE